MRRGHKYSTYSTEMLGAEVKTERLNHGGDLIRVCRRKRLHSWERPQKSIVDEHHASGVRLL